MTKDALDPTDPADAARIRLFLARPKAYHDERAAFLYDLYQSGATLYDLAELTGQAPTALGRLFAVRGWPRRRPGTRETPWSGTADDRAEWLAFRQALAALPSSECADRSA